MRTSRSRSPSTSITSTPTGAGANNNNKKLSISGSGIGKRYPSLTAVSRLSPVPYSSSNYYHLLNHPKKPTPPPMIFSRYPPDSPLVPRRRGHYSTSIAPSIENMSDVNSVVGGPTNSNFGAKTGLSRRRSLSLDDLGRKETLLVAACHHYSNNNNNINNSNDYINNTENFRENNIENESCISNSNLLCDTDDDLDDLPSSFAEETAPDDPNDYSLLKLDVDNFRKNDFTKKDTNIFVTDNIADAGSSTSSVVEPGEISSLSTIRESSSPVHSVIEEWSPTPPNEDDPEVHQLTGSNNNQDPNSKMTSKSPAHPIGLVHQQQKFGNLLSKWKNKIKK